MRPLDLNVPALTATASTPQLQDVQHWLDGLPKLASAQALAIVPERLQAINRLAFGPALRFTLAEGFLGVVEYLAEKLRRRCELLEFPASEQDRTSSAQLQRLLEELAISYKRVLMDLTVTTPPPIGMQPLLRDALLQALHLLGLRVLQAYTVYQPVPPGVWGDLHRLYRYAESIDITTVRVEHLADQSVGAIYRRILLLALANPFHLMQGEVRLTDERLVKWALAARIRHPAEFPSEAPQSFYAQRCHVDLEGDAPPCFGLLPGQMSPRDARILELRPVTQIVEDRIRQMTLKGQLPMQERLERDLLRRLRNAWNGRPARAGERSIQTGHVQVVAGLRAIHHAMSGGVEFHPEQDEIALHGSAFRAAPQLSLTPLEDEHWRHQDAHSKLEKGVLTPRSYGFDTERKEQDAWARSERAGTVKISQLEERLDSRLLNRRGLLQQHDVSVTGIGAHYDTAAGLGFRVGDLVRIEGKSSGQGSSGLGVVCWLRETAPGQMAVGFHRIEGAAMTLAVRGIEGTGTGSDYHRALGLNRDAARMLIVPAGSFELGSLVLYNARVAMGVLSLQRIIHSTKAFTLYATATVDLTPERREHVLKSLYNLLDRAMH